jgi:hypothetical protein
MLGDAALDPEIAIRRYWIRLREWREGSKATATLIPSCVVVIRWRRRDYQARGDFFGEVLEERLSPRRRPICRLRPTM